MSALTRKIMDTAHLGRAAPERDHSVSKLIECERPQDAVVGFDEHCSFEESLGFAVSGHAFSLKPIGG